MSAFRDAGGLKTIAAVHFRDAANALVDAAFVRGRNAGGALKTLFSSLGAAAAPASVKGYGNSGSPVNITTEVATCAVTGGVAPFTYAWSRTDAGGDSWSITSVGTASTAFTGESVETSAEATFACTVTDATGATAVSNEVSARAINLGGLL